MGDSINNINTLTNTESNTITLSDIYTFLVDLEDTFEDLSFRMYEYQQEADNDKFEGYLEDIEDQFINLKSFFSAENESPYLYSLDFNWILRKLSKVNVNLNIINKKKDLDNLGEVIREIYFTLDEVVNNVEYRVGVFKINQLNADSIEKYRKLKENLNQSEVLLGALKNHEIHKIYDEESTKFQKIATKYEMSFYIVIIIMTFYFLGLTIYISDISFSFIHVGFPEKNNGKFSPEFYIQKISLLVLSTTLAAFLLKRSFMNRRLADAAYRTAKELDALPRYMEGMPEEMKEKIRFDLAYKYFGNGIHHESYTGGENLMHENIKANTDFIKAVKDLTPKVEVPKADKAPKDAV
ncbi:hypothetical protein WH285_12380 [Acinetobacter johnsonii]|uniref:hypothetical protein n=1 Tax=Acinetobacter johnsonii TaxID=40214 RepID=UPI0030A3BB7F